MIEPNKQKQLAATLCRDLRRIPMLRVVICDDDSISLDSIYQMTTRVLGEQGVHAKKKKLILKQI